MTVKLHLDGLMAVHSLDRIVQEVERVYSHKTVKVELDSHSCEVIKKLLGLVILMLICGTKK
jgi:hypothetical protein